MFDPRPTWRPRVATAPSTMLTAMVVVELCSGVVQGYLPPLLPSLGLDLRIDTSAQNDVYLLSQLAAAALTPLLSRLGDMYGHRRILRMALGMVAVGSLLMAVWPTQVTLMTGVILQGATVGFMPLLIGILRTRAPSRSRFGIGLLVGVLLVSVGLGGLVSGVLSEHHAEAGLWVAVPVALLAVACGLLLPDSLVERGGRFNVIAAALLTVGLVAVVLAVAQGPSWGWSSPATLVSAVVGVASLALWLLREARSTHPLVNVRMLANRRLAAVCGFTFCLSFGPIGFLGANSTFLGTRPNVAGYGIGLGPQWISVVALAMVVAGLAGSLMARRLAALIGDRALLIGAGALTAVGFAILLVLHGSLPQYLAGALLVGLADGLCEAIARTLAVEAVTEDETAIAAGLNELALSIGAAIGSAVIGAIFTAHPLAGTQYVAASAYTWVWGTCAAVALVGTLLALRYRSTQGPPQPSGSSGNATASVSATGPRSTDGKEQTS